VPPSEIHTKTHKVDEIIRLSLSETEYEDTDCGRVPKDRLQWHDVMNTAKVIRVL